jgi:hypothetical protein
MGGHPPTALECTQHMYFFRPSNFSPKNPSYLPHTQAASLDLEGDEWYFLISQMERTIQD